MEAASRAELGRLANHDEPVQRCADGQVDDHDVPDRPGVTSNPAEGQARRDGRQGLRQRPPEMRYRGQGRLHDVGAGETKPLLQAEQQHAAEKSLPGHVIGQLSGDMPGEDCRLGRKC